MPECVRRKGIVMVENELAGLLELVRDNGWLLLAVLLPIVYVFGLPLIALATFRTQAKPTFERVEEGLVLPDEVGHYLEVARAHLLRLGFEELDRLYLPYQMANVKAILRLYVNRVERDSAMAVVLYGLIGQRWVLKMKYVEICRRFRDGTEVDTRNAKEIGSFPIPPYKTAIPAPWLRDIADLYGAHQAISNLVGGGKEGELSLDSSYHGDVPAYLSAGMIEELEDACHAGYLRRSATDGPGIEIAEDDDNPFRSPASPLPSAHYRATVKGACMMTWNELWPFKSLIRARHYRRARWLLAEAGFQG